MHMPRKPTTSQSTHTLSEPSTQLCPSSHLPVSTAIIHSQSPLQSIFPTPFLEITHKSTQYHGLFLPAKCQLHQSFATTTIFIRWWRSNIPGQNNNYSNVIQNHPLKDHQCIVSGTLDHKPITILIDTGSSISLFDEELYCLLSFLPPLQPIQFSVSGADDRALIALGITSLSIAIDDNTFQVQLVATRDILFPVVLGIDFLQTHGGIISFPTNQLYLTNSSPKLSDQPINANRICNTYTPPMHAPKPYHPRSRITVPPKPYHVINTAPEAMPSRTDTIVIIPCTLPRSKNSLFELSTQHFADQSVESTPVTVNAENDNLFVHCINHSDHAVVIPKHSYVGAMEKVQQSNQNTLPTNTSPEPVSQRASSKCLAHSDLLPSQRQSMHTPL